MVPSLGSTTAVDIDCCACVPLTSKAHLSGTTQDHSILGTIHKQEPITLSLIAQFLQYSPQLLSFTNFKKAKYNKYFKDLYSLRSKRFQSSYCAKVRAEAKKKVEGGGGGEKRKRLPANPTILENAP